MNINDEASLIFGGVESKSVGELVHIVIKTLEAYSKSLASCPCGDCQDFSRWSSAAQRCLSEAFQDMAYGSDPGTTKWLAKRALLYLAAQGATTELMRRVKKVQDHNEMVRLHENEE